MPSLCPSLALSPVSPQALGRRCHWKERLRVLEGAFGTLDEYTTLVPEAPRPLSESYFKTDLTFWAACKTPEYIRSEQIRVLITWDLPQLTFESHFIYFPVGALKKKQKQQKKSSPCDNFLRNRIVFPVLKVGFCMSNRVVLHQF